ncbi:MAG: hypothetical protein ABEJ28_12120 [Salinigranum sp.]
MQLTESVGSMMDSLRGNATVETVYGDPVERDGVTAIPIARVAYGFGGGYGSGTGGGESTASAGGADAEETGEVGETGEAGGTGERSEASPAAGEGGGFGGGLTVSPLGVVEIGRGETRFVRFDDRRRLGGAVLLGAVAGFLLGRRSRSE